MKTENRSLEFILEGESSLCSVTCSKKKKCCKKFKKKGYYCKKCPKA